MTGLLRGFAVLALATLVTQVVGFVAYAFAARHLGPDLFGSASVALVLAGYFAIPANFGLAVMAVRDIAREPDARREILAEVLLLRVVLALVMAGLMVAAGLLIIADAQTRDLVPLAALTIVASAFTGEWVLLGLERRGVVAVGRLVGQITYCVLVVAALGAGLGAAQRFVGYSVLSVLLVSVVTLPVAWRAIGGRIGGTTVAALLRRARESVPFGLALVMVQVYLSIGVLLTGVLGGTVDAGRFAVAQKIPLALYGLSDMWAATIFPVAARLMAEDRVALRRQVGTFITVGAAIAAPAAVGGALVANDLIERLFGAAYADAAASFAVLLAGLGLALVTVSFGGVLAAGGAERVYARLLAFGALLTLALDVALIPVLGIVGAAISVLVTEVWLLTSLARAYSRLVGPIEVQTAQLVRIAAGCGAIAAVLVVAGGLDVIVRVALAIVVYGAAALASGLLPRDRWRRPARER